jgi:hypothetical protein
MPAEIASIRPNATPAAGDLAGRHQKIYFNYIFFLGAHGAGGIVMASDTTPEPDITVDAATLGALLGVAAGEIPALLRARAITSLCERGTGTDEGRFRLSFFYRNRRARLHLDAAGCILRRGVIDFGEKRLPAKLRRAGDSVPAMLRPRQR